MKDIIDRNVQKLLLDTAYTSYPDHPPIGTFDKLLDIVHDGDKLVANMLYLEEHGLIKSGIRHTIDGHFLRDQTGFRITSEGIDFLLDDGGLSAILKVVTVKIHADSLAQIEAFIMSSSLDKEDKKKFSSRLRELPFETTKHLLSRLLDLGLNQVPNAMQIIQNALAGG